MSTRKYLNIVMNKKAVSMSIGILVLSSFVLSLVSLTYFINKDNSIREIVRVSGDIDEIYLRKDLLDFYLQDIFDKSVEGFTIGSANSRGFIERFKEELLKLKDKEGFYPMEELETIEKRIFEDSIINNVEIMDNRLIFRLEVRLEKGYSREDDRIALTYDYIKEFEKVFK